MEHIVETGESGTVLTLNGELTLPHAPVLRDALVESLSRGKNVTVRFLRVGEIDLSCLQLLCSSHRTAVEKGLSLTLDMEDRELFERFRTAAGFVRARGCSPGREHTCLWLEQLKDDG